MSADAICLSQLARVQIFQIQIQLDELVLYVYKP